MDVVVVEAEEANAMEEEKKEEGVEGGEEEERNALRPQSRILGPHFGSVAEWLERDRKRLVKTCARGCSRKIRST